MNKIFRHSVLSLLCVFAVTSTAFARVDLPSFAPLVKEAGPAVVNISTERVVKSNNFGGAIPGMPPGMERFFEQFGPFFNGQQGGGKERLQSALGTGFIISSDGYIVTNNHVVEGADKIFVNLEGATSKAASVEAELIGMDPETDIALLKVKVDKTLPTLTFGDSDALEVGEWVLAIGNPFGLSSTVTAGILSAKGRNIHSGPYDNFLQTDASINPGNSGGPLINMQGEVIGINTAIAASGQGIGFAIPSKLAASIVEQLKTGQKVSRGWIGVSIQDLDEMTAKALGIDQDSGALIASVMPGEPAEKAGLRSGDIVIRIGDAKIESSSDLTREIASYKPKSEVKILVMRDGKQKVFTVKLGERNTGLQASAPQKAQEGASLGVTLRPLTDEDRRVFQLEKNTQGLIILEVSANGRAAHAGIRSEDIILAANLKPVGTAKDLAEIINSEGKKRGAVVLQVFRQGNTFIIPISMSDEK